MGHLRVGGGKARIRCQTCPVKRRHAPLVSSTVSVMRGLTEGTRDLFSHGVTVGDATCVHGCASASSYGKAIPATQGVVRRGKKGGAMLAIVTDELSYDLETAVSIGWNWGIRSYELRRVYLERAPFYPEAFFELLPTLRRIYDGIEFVAISPGLFKCPVDHWSVPHQLGLKLDASFRLAEMVGCRLILVFGFERPAGKARELRPPQRVVEALNQAAERARRNDFVLAIEIEQGSYADGGTAAAQLVEAVDSPALGINMQRWDPALTGDPWDVGFERMRRHIRHMHYHGINAPEFGGAEPGKDFRWAPKLAALKADGYRGYISVETHLKPRLERSEVTLKALRRVLEEAGVVE